MSIICTLKIAGKTDANKRSMGVIVAVESNLMLVLQYSARIQLYRFASF